MRVPLAKEGVDVDARGHGIGRAKSDIAARLNLVAFMFAHDL